ncbi:Amino acid permease [Enhygromyxa salina]|uniref:Amino acid permease n=1 Tax=Enhygromyxa salina TaxID=215803 RepID=A0A0C2CMU7_9BACT|nr:amino acid permease [Enhygromyxa salina]KIG12581.1 Amino acid permease [Enhygromyxa salina]
MSENGASEAPADSAVGDPSDESAAASGDTPASAAPAGSSAGSSPGGAVEAVPHQLSWREGLYLVGPDPLTSPYYSSGALIGAGIGYATPLFQIGLYLLLFLLAPLYVEAVLLTLSNGGTYVMTRYALGHLGKLAILAAAMVGIVISFSYVATAIVSLLAYSDYLYSLVAEASGPRTLMAMGLSMIPSIGFGVWVMPSQWRRVVISVSVTALIGLMLSAVMSATAVIMLPPLVMLFILNNQGLKESIQVSKTIFLINLVVMGITIVICLVYLMINGADFSRFMDGAALPKAVVAAAEAGGQGDTHEHHGLIHDLPGFYQLLRLGAPVILAGAGVSILGASGVESVMNIPEELASPRRDVAKIYRWMLSLLLGIGGSLSILLFLVLSPQQLTGSSSYLLAVLGQEGFLGVFGSSGLANLWKIVIVANAALMLIGACNTGFAGARGLWQTMARDSLLPRMILDPNERGAFSRIHWMMLVAILLLAIQGDWDLSKLERWYGVTFGLVLFSGVIAFILLRKFRAEDRRIYRAPFNLTIGGTKVPVAALIGLVVLGYALMSMYISYSGEIGELRTLVGIVMAGVVGVILLYNHRPLMRAMHSYYRRVIETVESTAIETEDRTVVVAVGSVRIGRLIENAIALAKMQSKTTGIPYRQLVVFHMSSAVTGEHVYEINRSTIRPAKLANGAVRIFTKLTEVAPADMRVYLAIVPPITPGGSDHLSAALDTLVDFHNRHNFTGHMVLVGTHGVKHEEYERLQQRLDGSTLIPVPLYGE